VEKLTQTWGERFAREAKGLVARHQPRVPALQWLGPFVRRVSPRPPPPTRYARIEPTDPRKDRPLDDSGLIPVDVRERLRDIVGPAIDQARVHTGPAADAFARARGADAVTVGNDIMFRDGHYRPHDPHGFALLAHEGTHIAAAVASSALRGTDAGVAAEEARARLAEARALAHPTFAPNRPAPLPSGAFAPAPAPVPASTGGPHAPALAAKPMAAASDRTTSAPASTPSFDVNELKRSIYRELLQTIRSDAERGG
jgi:hypothetical protein